MMIYIFTSYIQHNPFLTHPCAWACFLNFFYLLTSSPWLCLPLACGIRAFVLFLRMELFPSKPAIPWAPGRLKVSSGSWSSISWSSSRCSTRGKGSLGGAGAAGAVSQLYWEGRAGVRSQRALKQPYKHINRFRTYSPGCLSVLSNRKCHFFNLSCSKQRAVAAWCCWNQWKWLSAGSLEPLRGQH